MKATITSKGELNTKGDLICYSDVNLPATVNMGYNVYSFKTEVEFNFSFPLEYLILDKVTGNFGFYKNALEVVQPNGKSRTFTEFTRTIALNPDSKFLPNGVKDTYTI